MQNMVVEPFVFRAKSASTLEWGWEDVALAACVATALTSVAIVMVAVIFRCNKLAQQREQEKARFAAPESTSSCATSHTQVEMENKTSRRPTKGPKMSPALKPAKWRVSETAQAQQLLQASAPTQTTGTPVVEKAQAMAVPKMQPRTPPLPPAPLTTSRRVNKSKEDKRVIKPAPAGVEATTEVLPSSPQRQPLRLNPSSSAKMNTKMNQATLAKGPQLGAQFNFSARRAFRCQ